jgi:hypothetical protein
MRDILTSRRVRIAIGALILWAAARFGLDLDPGAVDRVIDLAMVVIASFGLSGFGKDRSAQEIEAAKGGVVVARMEMTTIPPPIAAQPPPLPPPPATSPRATPTSMLGKVAGELRDEARARMANTSPERPGAKSKPEGE